MKRIGLLGGMSWESTELYYRWINEGIKQQLGKLHSAEVILWSVDFEEIEQRQHEGNWEQLGSILSDAGLALEKAGAEFLVICTNTMHKVVPQMEQALSIPILHIADAAAAQLKANHFTQVGLLGTQFTMSQDFYKGRLQSKHDLDVLVPESSDQSTIHDIIYQELCLGKVLPESKEKYQKIIQTLQEQGAQAIIAGCTEIGMLIQANDISLPLFDTAHIHAQAAVQYALE